MRHLKVATALAVGLLVGATAVAIAVSPPQQYTGCLSKDGTIGRVAVGTAPIKSCGPNETMISWNSQGPQGDPGPTGQPGAAGSAGLQGEPGPAGPPLTSFDDLDGLPCNEGTVYESRIAVTYNINGSIAIACPNDVTYTLTLIVSGPGSVNYMDEANAGNNCWAELPTGAGDYDRLSPCVTELPAGFTTNLSPSGGAVTWSGGCPVAEFNWASAYMDQDQTCTATFAP